MKNLLFLLAFLTSNFLAGQRAQNFAAAKSPADVGFSEERLARIDTLLQGYVDRGVVPSVVTFVARRGQIVHHKAFGMPRLGEKTAARTDDIYRIMSQTKLITTVGLLILLEEGKFHLDQNISDFLPAFKNMKVLGNPDERDPAKYFTKPAARAITFRHLLSHTAGIPYNINGVDEKPEFAVPMLATIGNEKLEDVVNKIAARPLISEPGEKYVYGWNTDIVGRLIEVLSGQPLDIFLKNRVCDPLGMTDTYFYLPKEKAARLVGLWSQDNRGEKPHEHANEIYRKYPTEGGRSLFYGGSGMSGTISDYARICQLIVNKGEFNGHRLLAPATVNLMLTNQIGENFVWDRRDKFGLGLQIFSPETKYGDNATPGAAMWGGYFSTEYVIDVEKELVLLVYTNVQPFAQGGEVSHKFRTMVYAALME